MSVCLQLFGQNLAVESGSRALMYFDNVGLETCASPLLAVGEKGGTQPSHGLVLQSCRCLSKGSGTLSKIQGVFVTGVITFTGVMSGTKF